MFFKLPRQKNKGFSIIEMIVVVAIFSIISGIVLWNYGRFSSNLVITNLAYQAALAVREAQVYGISVKQTKTGASFSAAYGVWFTATNNQQFYLFSDANGNHLYDVANETEDIYKLNGSSKISQICAIGISVTYCSNIAAVPGSYALNGLSVVFSRPNPDANIYVYDGASIVNAAFQKTEIQFSSTNGDKVSRLTVTNTGQISIDTCNNRLTNKCQGF